eukprot:378404_1
MNVSMLAVYLITIVLNMAYTLCVLLYLIVTICQRGKIDPTRKNEERMYNCLEPDTIDNASYGLIFGVIGGLILAEILMAWMVKIVYKLTMRFEAVESPIDSEDIHS